MQPQASAHVKMGDRVYKHAMWSRQDEIFVGAHKIGIIKLKCNDRQGRTISLVTQTSIVGRKVQWCVEQSAASLLRPGEQT